MPITIFMLVRPSSEWLNTSWWKWVVFLNSSLDDWLQSFSLNDYKTGLERWLNLPNVVNYDVVDMQDDPVAVFAKIFSHRWKLNQISCNITLLFFNNNYSEWSKYG